MCDLEHCFEDSRLNSRQLSLGFCSDYKSDVYGSVLYCRFLNDLYPPPALPTPPAPLSPGLQKQSQTDEGLLPLCLGFLLHHLLLLGCDQELRLLAFPEGEKTVQL